MISHKIILLASIFQTSAVFADFDEVNRSINGTGETLPERACEIGFKSLGCGLTNNFMAVAPTLAILTGISEFEMRYRIGFPSSMRLSPALIAGTPVHFGGRIDGGMDFGSSREHSVTLTAESDWAAKTELPVEDYAPDKAYRFTRYIGGEYDYYNRGNIAYAGVSRKVPYLGYTWAWTSVRLGLITSPLSRFIPLPYIYWRF